MSLLMGASSTITGQCAPKQYYIFGFLHVGCRNTITILVLPLALLQRLCRGTAHYLVLIARTEHYIFNGLHGGLWMNLLRIDDLLGFKQPELLFALSYENRW